MNDTVDKVDALADAVPADRRQVFPYFDGEKTVWGDPLLLFRRLEYALQGRAAAVIRAAYADPPDDRVPDDVDPSMAEQALAGLAAEHAEKVFHAREQLVPAVRSAFYMVPLDRSTERNPQGRGATEQHCMDALDAWLEFYSSKKKPTAPSLT